MQAGNNVFTSEWTVSIDAKGRVAIPTHFRADIDTVCGGELVFTYSVEDNGSIWLYPKPEWETVCNQILAVKSKSRQVRRTRLRIVNSAIQIQPDASGRVVLPPKMRATVGLERQVVFMGGGKKFELWNEQALAIARGDLLDFDDDEIDPALESIDY